MMEHKLTARFLVEGREVPYAELVDSNAEDQDVREFALLAKVGDVFPAFVRCERIA